MSLKSKKNGEIVKANLTNEQIVEVPNTMANNSKLYTVISITCMVVGMGVFLYVSKKNKKKIRILIRRSN
ncbi:MAG: hypothetical protein L6V78_04600 [Clostridium sp.]|nr:MAG: hypothetical protein L6V78_04600 [Clostridium sp.]